MTTEKPAAPAEAAPASESTEAAEAGAADELGVLFPDVELTMRDPETGESVALTVREFRFREGLEAQAAARPLIEAFTALVERAGAEGVEDSEIGVAAIDWAIGEHPEIWLELVALATGRTTEWLARLSDRDAQALSGAMWQSNGPFFVRRIVAGVTGKQAMAGLFRSLASSTASSAPVTDAATTTSAGA